MSIHQAVDTAGPIYSVPAPGDIRKITREAPDAPAKLILDKIGAVMGLVLFAPVMAVIALLLYVTEGGPVLFGHARVGKGGRSFRCLKFRTMRVDATETLNHILDTDPIARDEWETSFKFERDPRVTALGRFLRKSSLDELPQFWNVLRGDMSLVGPRPVTGKELRLYGRHASAYLSIRPGVTGLWQISGRSDTTYDERVALDLSYIQSLSVWRDIRIMLQTVSTVLLRRGAV